MLLAKTIKNKSSSVHQRAINNRGIMYILSCLCGSNEWFTHHPIVTIKGLFWYLKETHLMKMSESIHFIEFNREHFPDPFTFYNVCKWWIISWKCWLWIFKNVLAELKWSIGFNNTRGNKLLEKYILILNNFCDQIII